MSEHGARRGGRARLVWAVLSAVLLLGLLVGPGCVRVILVSECPTPEVITVLPLVLPTTEVHVRVPPVVVPTHVPPLVVVPTHVPPPVVVPRHVPPPIVVPTHVPPAVVVPTHVPPPKPIVTAMPPVVETFVCPPPPPPPPVEPCVPVIPCQ
jgi:hypothetical protein